MVTINVEQEPGSGIALRTVLSQIHQVSGI
jgi:hypothetical protein